MNKSETIGKLAAALAKAQGQLEPAKKDAKGNFGKFADLGEVIDTIRKVSVPNGLSFSQFPVGDAVGVGVSTILMHESGEWLSETIYLAASEDAGKRNAAQLAGGNITYLRRYALASIFGVYADEDTEGAQAVRNQTAQAKPQAKPEQWTRDMSEWEPFAAVAKELGMNLESVKEILQVTNIHEYKGTRQQAEQEIRKAAAITTTTIPPLPASVPPMRRN